MWTSPFLNREVRTDLLHSPDGGAERWAEKTAAGREQKKNSDFLFADVVSRDANCACLIAGTSVHKF